MLSPCLAESRLGSLSADVVVVRLEVLQADVVVVALGAASRCRAA